MADTSTNSLFAPPTQKELSGDLFAPPSKEEMGQPEDSVFAPPQKHEIEGTAKPEASVPDILTDADFQRLGNKYGVNASDLKSLAPYYFAKVQPTSLGEAAEVGAKSAAGFLGRAAFNIPQKLYSQSQSPEMQSALSEIQDIANNQQGLISKAAEIVASPAAGLGSTAAARIGSSAAVGGLIGYGASKPGEETKEALKGAALGGALGVGGELLGKVTSKLGATKLEKELADRESRQAQFNLEKGADDIAAATRKSEDILENSTIGSAKEALTPDEVKALVKEQVGEESLARYLNPATEEGALIRNRALKRAAGETQEQAVERQLADDIIESRARDFAEDLTGKRPASYEDAIEDIQKIASRQGEEAVANRYQDFTRSKQAERYIEESGVRAMNEPGFFGRAANFISDNQFVLRGLDEKYGTRTEDILRELNKDFNRSTFALGKFRHDYDDVFQRARKLGTDDTVRNTDRIYSALDTGNTADLTPEELETLKGFRQYFDEIRNFVNGKVKEKDPRIAPLAIPYRENYVPKMLKATPELVPVMERKVEEATQELGSRLGRNINDLAQLRGTEFKIASQLEPVKQLIQAVELVDNKAVKDGADLSSRLKQMLYSREGNIGLETKARAAMERAGEIPDFLLEKNLYKLARRYTDNTIKHLYLRSNVDKLRYQADLLKKAGAQVEGNYVGNIVRDILGVRKGTAAEAVLQSRIKVAQKLDSLIDRVGKDSFTGGALTAVKAMPDMFQSLTRQIYPNVLGYWNVRAILQNATQGLTKSAPELGTKYGYATLLRGAVNTVGNFKRLSDKAKQLGSVPEEFIRKGEQAIADGIQRSSLYRIPAAALDGMAKAGMILFQKSEEFNRALVLGMSEVMARDLARGSKLAQESLTKFPRNIRNEILANASNPEYTATLLGKYLNDATQYNYNRASMSEFGRVMGPFFSTFSKWPTATAGDIIQEFRNKGLLKGSARNIEKYVAPLVLLQTIDFIAGERMGDQDSLSDREKKLLGSHGISQSAPLGSVGAIAKGELFTPPVVDSLITGVVNPILKGDSASLERGLGTAAGNFLPGAGLFRFITDDVVTYLTNERPEGGSQLEKDIEGMRRIVK